jgi:hypothetical protein
MDIGFEGHNNDQSNWTNSIIGANPAQYLADHERLLADKGYAGNFIILSIYIIGIFKRYKLGAVLIVPQTEAAASQDLILRLYNLSHQEARLIIEFCNGYLKRFRAISSQVQFRHSVPFQVQTIHCGGLLANRQIKANSLR